MSINKPYRTADELPAVIPIFPLAGVLLLPRGELPLNIFEERYLTMLDDAVKTHRVIGMIQPAAENAEADDAALAGIGCAGRITEFGETGDGRYLLTLTGIARFRVEAEMETTTPYRQCSVDFSDFLFDFTPGLGEGDVDRDGIIETLRDFATQKKLKIDWDGIARAPNEWLVNSLSMMSPCGSQEKQALLEAADLKTRAEILVAVTQRALAPIAHSRYPLH